MKKALLIFFAVLLPLGRLHAGLEADLDRAFSKQQWDDVIQGAYQGMRRDPSPGVKLKAAYALFQKGLVNSGLVFLKQISEDDWRKLSQGQDRLAEISLLFQKKVPVAFLPGRISRVKTEEVNPRLQDEVHFSKGLDAFERGSSREALAELGAVSQASRFYPVAHYLLGGLALKEKNYRLASDHFAAVFAPSVFTQSSEFWKDLSTQVSSHWGDNLQVRLGSDALQQANTTGELALLGLARTNYAAKSFEAALQNYTKLSPQSEFYPRAQLEMVWTLLSLAKHDEAQKLALQLSTTAPGFELVESKVLRALVLIDYGKTEEAREELNQFLKLQNDSLKSIEDYTRVAVPTMLPPYLQHDLAANPRLQTLKQYELDLQVEVDQLAKQDNYVYPVYGNLVNELRRLISQVQDYHKQFAIKILEERKKDLHRLALQTKLLFIESYLEDREKLRAEFQGQENKNDEHDQKLVAILSKAVTETNEVRKVLTIPLPALEFRQAELLWELAAAKSLASLGQTDPVLRKQLKDEAEGIQRQSLQLAREVVSRYPQFEKRSDGLFFIGYAETQIGNYKAGLQSLQAYVTTYPRGTSAPDAYRILADERFDHNDFAGAENDYNHILSFPDSPILGYALYKMAWCAYNLRNYTGSLTHLEQAIRWAQAGRGGKMLTLQREATKDIIGIYAEMGDHAHALEYFKNISPEEADRWILDFVAELESLGQFEKSIDIRRTLILSKSSDENVRHQASIVNSEFKLHHWARVLDAAKELKERFASATESVQAESTPAAFAEKTLRDICLAQLFEFKLTDDRETLDRIEGLNAVYLDLFRSWPGSQEVLYPQAHLLVRRKKIAEAAILFKRHWDQFGATLKEPLREEALRNLLHTLDETERAQKAEASAISDTGNDILTYTAQYLAQYSKDKHARSVGVLRTAVFFKYKRTEEGILEAQRIFNENPNDAEGELAFKNLRVAYYDRKDWKKTADWTRDLLASSLPILKYKQDLTTIRDEADFLVADGNTDHKQSADLFLKLSSDAGSPQLRAKSLYNAFVRLKAAGDTWTALTIASRLEKDHPTYDGISEIAGVRAASYLDAGDYDHAAPLLERFIHSKGKADSTEAQVVAQAKLNLGFILLAKQEAAKARVYFTEVVAQRIPQSEAAAHAMDNAGSAGLKFPNWEKLVVKRSAFEKAAIPAKGDLATRIQGGATQLEKIAKEFLDISQSKDTPDTYAFEAYCTLPLLYDTFASQLMKLANKDEAVKAELEKIAGPLRTKASDLAGECIKRSDEQFHSGPVHLAVLERWGWRRDQKMRITADDLREALERQSPQWDAAADRRSADEIVESHIRGMSTEDSWYALALRRVSQKMSGLALLTLKDAYHRYPNSGKILNAIALLQYPKLDTVHAAALVDMLEKAARTGSRAAWVNLTYLHLQGGRLTQAVESLKKARELQAFGDDTTLRPHFIGVFQ